MGEHTDLSPLERDVPRLLEAVQAMTEVTSRMSQRAIDAMPPVLWERLERLSEAFEPFAEEVGR
jgi:hypothetical protein